MSRFRWIVILSLFACLVVPTSSAEADPVVYGVKTKVARLFEHELGRDQTRSWQQFKRACCYFGAYAINTETDHGGFAQGFNSLKAAIDAAEVICREVSKAEKVNPKACKLYADSVPAEISAVRRVDGAPLGIGHPKLMPRQRRLLNVRRTLPLRLLISVRPPHSGLRRRALISAG
jgi:hypothetical protein